MPSPVGPVDYLFFGCLLIAGLFCIREIFSNILFLRDEIKAPKKIRLVKLPAKNQAILLVAIWGAMTALFAGGAAILFSKPFRIISGFSAAPSLYGWNAALIMLMAAIACGLLTYRYYLLWMQFR